MARIAAIVRRYCPALLPAPVFRRAGKTGPALAAMRAGRAAERRAHAMRRPAVRPAQ